MLAVKALLRVHAEPELTIVSLAQGVDPPEDIQQ